MKKVIFRSLFGIISSLLLFTASLQAMPTSFPEIAQNHNNRRMNRNNQVKWEEFKSKEGGFSVMLPSKPDHIEQSIDVPNTNLKIDYDTFVSEPSDSVVYVISVWHYPPEIDMTRPEINLQDGFGGMLSALPGSKVIKMDLKEIDGFKGLEFLVKNEDIYFQGELILVYNTLYQVFVVYRDTADMSKDYKKFINSFKLINPEKNKVKPKNASRRMNV